MLNIGLCLLLLFRAQTVLDCLVPSSREMGQSSERDKDVRELGLWVQMDLEVDIRVACAGPDVP